MGADEFDHHTIPRAEGYTSALLHPIVASEYCLSYIWIIFAGVKRSEISIMPISGSLHERKSAIINALFVERADMDYLLARLAYHSGLFHNFYFLAAQGLEKYMKAYLLYNNVSAKDVGHDLKKLFNIVIDIDENSFVPKNIDFPETTATHSDTWNGKAMSLFIFHLNDLGHTDNRYGIVGTFINGPIIHALDQLCHGLRVAINKKNFFGCSLIDHYQKTNGFTDRVSSTRPWMINGAMILEGLFEKRYQVGLSNKVRDAFLNMNFSYSEEIETSVGTFGGVHLTGSPLYAYLVHHRNLDKSQENHDKINELHRWVSQNIHVSPRLWRQLEAEVKKNAK